MVNHAEYQVHQRHDKAFSYTNSKMIAMGCSPVIPIAEPMKQMISSGYEVIIIPQNNTAYGDSFSTIFKFKTLT